VSAVAVTMDGATALWCYCDQGSRKPKAEGPIEWVRPEAGRHGIGCAHIRLGTIALSRPPSRTTATRPLAIGLLLTASSLLLLGCNSAVRLLLLRGCCSELPGSPFKSSGVKVMAPTECHNFFWRFLS